MIFVLLIGCSPRMPVAAPIKPKAAKPLPATIAAPPQEIAMADLPFLKSKKKTPVAPQALIVLDPGHGGDDYGTHSLGTPRYQEKHLNLSTAQIVKNLLQQAGYEVIMTRNDDTFVSLDNRAMFANKLNPALFLSIHYNSAPSRDAEGIEVFYYRDRENPLRQKKSNILAQSVLNKVIKNTKAKSRGVKAGNLSVIRQTEMPAVLIEGGFMTCAKEMDKLKDAAYIKSIAVGISQGIQDYLAKQNLLAEN